MREEATPDPASSAPRARMRRRPPSKAPVSGGGYVVLLIAGIVVFVLGAVECYIAARSDATPQTITAEALIANGYGNNAHVIVTRCLPFDGYVFVEKEDKGSRTTSLEEAWVPCMSADWVDPEDGSDPPVFCLKFTDVRGGLGTLKSLIQGETFTGVVISDFEWVSSSNGKLLDDMFRPGGYSNVTVLQVGRKPKTYGPWMVFGGLAVIALCGYQLWRLNRPASPDTALDEASDRAWDQPVGGRRKRA